MTVILVTAAEIARRVGYSQSGVMKHARGESWPGRRAGSPPPDLPFPAPADHVIGIKVYPWEAVRTWYGRHGS